MLLINKQPQGGVVLKQRYKSCPKRIFQPSQDWCPFRAAISFPSHVQEIFYYILFDSISLSGHVNTTAKYKNIGILLNNRVSANNQTRINQMLL